MMVMFVEAVVVLIRKDSHFRVTRCLRPVFFIDSHLMIGVRRYIKFVILERLYTSHPLQNSPSTATMHEADHRCYATACTNGCCVCTCR